MLHACVSIAVAIPMVHLALARDDPCSSSHYFRYFLLRILLLFPAICCSAGKCMHTILKICSQSVACKRYNVCSLCSTATHPINSNLEARCILVIPYALAVSVHGTAWGVVLDAVRPRALVFQKISLCVVEIGVWVRAKNRTRSTA